MAQKQKILLIVEDNPLQLKWLTTIFKKNFRILSATTGLQAQELFSIYLHDIDVLILNVRLPDMTAFELLNSLEKMCFTGIPPIIIETEYEDKAWMQEMFGEHRTLNYLVKPFTQKDIEDAVKHALNADPFLYKGAQIEERMAVMSALNKIRGTLYQKIIQLPQESQSAWMPEFLSLFQTFGFLEGDEFPSGSKDDFNLTASLAPIFNFVRRFCGIPIPSMNPFRVGVPSDSLGIMKSVDARMFLEKSSVNLPQFNLIEIDHPSPDDTLDFWVSHLDTNNLNMWRQITPNFLPYQSTPSVCGIAVIKAQDTPLLKDAILIGIPCVVVKIQNFEERFYKFLVNLAIRQYELNTLQALALALK